MMEDEDHLEAQRPHNPDPSGSLSGGHPARHLLRAQYGLGVQTHLRIGKYLGREMEI